MEILGRVRVLVVIPVVRGHHNTPFCALVIAMKAITN
jgi:hypothetical protein